LQRTSATLNVRKALDVGQEDSSVEELAANIREKGPLSSLSVRPPTDGRFEILVCQTEGVGGHGIHAQSHRLVVSPNGTWSAAEGAVARESRPGRLRALVCEPMHNSSLSRTEKPSILNEWFFHN